MYRKDYIQYPATNTCENGEYVETVFADYVITSDEMIQKAKAIAKKSFLQNVYQKIYTFYQPFH